ncbi:MAG TPA: sulfotransferase [Solirubrobacteraceae bacterium]|nr:sulfotransferase [Solirubrobacteraceae bacterium]
MSVSAPSAGASEAYRLAQAGRVEEALARAERAVAGARVCLPEHGFLASVLLRLGRVADAEEVVAQAVELAPGAADAYDGLAFVSMALGRHDRANALYRRATEVAPQDPRFWYNLACSERSLGRLAAAEAACDRAIALDATQYPSYLLRSELRVQSPQANHIAELRSQLARPGLEHRARIFLGYALGKELDDIGQFDAAFQSFAAAAEARRSRLAYDVATDERKLARIAEVYPSELLARPAPRTAASQGAVDASRYVFIVGLPRSGTTLTERILTGLAGARSNGETDHFSRALLAAARGEGDVFRRAAAADTAEVAAGYARLADPGVAAVRIIEKLPLNYLYVGAIHRALPEARILLVSRSPLDSCFAMYRTLFAAGYPFSYDLVQLARYYAAYAGLMNHWRSALCGRLHEIVYEELVREPRRVGAAVADYCGLAWSDAAVEIQNNRSVSLTASAAQVRRPIYGSSTGRWRHYRAHLGLLIDTLRAHGVAVDD